MDSVDASASLSVCVPTLQSAEIGMHEIFFEVLKREFIYYWNLMDFNS